MRVSECIRSSLSRLVCITCVCVCHTPPPPPTRHTVFIFAKRRSCRRGFSAIALPIDLSPIFNRARSCASSYSKLCVPSYFNYRCHPPPPPLGIATDDRSADQCAAVCCCSWHRAADAALSLSARTYTHARTHI